jgi:hypothetical protein
MLMKRDNKQWIILGFQRRYKGKRRREKSALISEACETLGVSRKHAIRLLNVSDESIVSGGRGQVVRRGRPGRYQDRDFKAAVRLVWREMRHPCGRVLKMGVPLWLDGIERAYGGFVPGVRERLLEVSASTLDRILREYRANRGRTFTRNGGFREEIPIQGNIWNIGVPGYLEADTVALCGSSMMGEFINTLVMVDIATLWNEVRAVFGRGSNAVHDALRDIEHWLPFWILGYDADNGGEVMNRHLYAYFVKERTDKGLPPVKVTRSRPYKKNDNAHVEQRNDVMVRRYLGYERLEFIELVPIINYYYADIVCPLVNYFMPSFKLSEKRLVKSRTRRIYANPLTPYQRLMASAHLSTIQKLRLKMTFNSLDPVKLSQEERRVRRLIDNSVKLLRASRPLPRDLPQYKLWNSLLSH